MDPADEGAGAWMRTGIALAAVLATIAASYLLAVSALRGSLPLLGVLYAVPLTAVVGASIFAGTRGGLFAAVPASAFAVWHYYQLDGIFPSPADRLTLGGAVAFLTFGMAALAGYLKKRDGRRTLALLHAEHERLRLLERSRRELAEKNEDLERVNRALAAVNEGLESFAYVVSHDLKEPVRAMTALLEEAEEKTAQPEVRETVHMARTSNDRLAKLLTGLLEVARASRVDPHDLRPVHPIEVLESETCATRFAAMRDQRHARIESAALLGTPLVLATEEHLCQILGNLVLNAIKHNDKTAPLVRVRVAPQDAEAKMIVISVEDDGPGFEPHVVDQLGRVKPGRPTTVHGGFGLIIARRAVERLGGKVWVDKSEELGGAAVHFTLPAATSARSEEAHGDGAVRPRGAWKDAETR